MIQISSSHITISPRSRPALPPGSTGLDAWNDVLVRLSRVPALTVAALRGRARGAGSEFVLACDVRFASKERAVLGQFEVGGGAVPGGGPMARLSRLVGRGRALEILVGADDFTSELAERYGYVNRAVPDAELDTFIDRFARRVAGFEKEAIVGPRPSSTRPPCLRSASLRPTWTRSSRPLPVPKFKLERSLYSRRVWGPVLRSN
jgi:enoyl-CoA hydratase/carnithine racemase